MAYKITKKNVVEAMNKSEHLDGRKPFEHREIKVKFGVSNKAEGSVSVEFGKTHVVAGIKMNMQEPYTDHEKEGGYSTMGIPSMQIQLCRRIGRSKT